MEILEGLPYLRVHLRVQNFWWGGIDYINLGCGREAGETLYFFGADFDFHPAHCAYCLGMAIK